MKEWITKLYTFIKKLYIFTKLSS